VLMVAAHADDLEAAAAVGLRTAYVTRPTEWGPGSEPEAVPEGVDLVARDLHDLADQL
jgi:2-haloacid dehalogenase